MLSRSQGSDPACKCSSSSALCACVCACVRACVRALIPLHTPLVSVMHTHALTVRSARTHARTHTCTYRLEWRGGSAAACATTIRPLLNTFGDGCSFGCVLLRASKRASICVRTRIHTCKSSWVSAASFHLPCRALALYQSHARLLCPPPLQG